MSIAVWRRRSAACPLLICGRAERSHATAPATIGAAKLVPDARVRPSAVPSGVARAPGIARGMCSPGAPTSIDAFALEKYDEPFCWFVAATDRTWRQAAGKLIG